MSKLACGALQGESPNSYFVNMKSHENKSKFRHVWIVYTINIFITEALMARPLKKRFGGFLYHCQGIF